MKHKKSFEFVPGSKNIRMTIFVIIITALIAGGTVYAWHSSKLKSIEEKLQQQISVLQNQIEQLQQKNSTSSRSQTNSQEKTKAAHNDKSNWTTYINSKYNYQISYPENVYTTENLFNPDEEINLDNFALFDIEATKEIIECQCGEGGKIVISAHSNPERLSPGDYLKQNFKKWLGFPSTYSDFSTNEVIRFAGLEAKKFGTERDRYILLTKDKSAFTISPYDYDESVIKTFKFVD